MELESINRQLKGKSPEEIVDWALELAKRPVVTTNFRPYEAAILKIVSEQKSDIPVIWCDSGYNTRATYLHADKIIRELKLNVHLYVPQQSTAYRDVFLGIPEIDTPEHVEFTRQVKLEPFNRAMKEHQPDVWFTNLRQGQTNFRSNLDVVSISKDGILKVSPFFYYTDEDLETYCKSNELEVEHNYYDPTKALANRECGLHT